MRVSRRYGWWLAVLVSAALLWASLTPRCALAWTDDPLSQYWIHTSQEVVGSAWGPWWSYQPDEDPFLSKDQLWMHWDETRVTSTMGLDAKSTLQNNQYGGGSTFAGVLHPMTAWPVAFTGQGDNEYYARFMIGTRADKGKPTAVKQPVTGQSRFSVVVTDGTFESLRGTDVSIMNGITSAVGGAAGFMWLVRPIPGGYEWAMIRSRNLSSNSDGVWIPQEVVTGTWSTVPTCPKVRYELDTAGWMSDADAAKREPNESFTVEHTGKVVAGETHHQQIVDRMWATYVDGDGEFPRSPDDAFSLQAIIDRQNDDPWTQEPTSTAPPSFETSDTPLGTVEMSDWLLDWFSRFGSAASRLFSPITMFGDFLGDT